MLILRLLDLALDAARVTGSCTLEECPGSAFSAITAALATQGYYMQSQIIYSLAYSSGQAFAVLVYVLAAISGIISMAMGMPPKLYLWFFMGPAMYHFLLGTTVDVKGVRWQVGDFEPGQGEVWRLAQPGIKNITVKSTPDFGGGWIGDLFNFLVQQGIINFPWSEAVPVSWFYSYLDQLVSNMTQQLTSWFGYYADVSNIGKGSKQPDYWYLISSMKWEAIDNIVSATLSSTELRDAFVTFLASGCGDTLKAQIDPAAYARATKSSGARQGTPASVFKNPEKKSFDQALDDVVVALNKGNETPTPESLRKFVSENGFSSPTTDQEGATYAGHVIGGSFLDFLTKNGNVPSDDLGRKIQGGTDSRLMACGTQLELIIQGFRWEAAHTYYEVLRSFPQKPMGNTNQVELFTGPEIGKIIFGDWLFAMPKYDQNGQWIMENGVPQTQFIGNSDAVMNEDFYRNLMIDLITVYLFKNEMVAAPRLGQSGNVTAGDKQKSYVETNLKTTGQKSKAGEFYVWAKMLPYLQGVLLYCLSIAYPFVCILIMIPGWHKMLFTWISFFIWVKLWDLGFAVVTLLERSVWASIGSGEDSANRWAPIINLFMNENNKAWANVTVDSSNAALMYQSSPVLSEPGSHTSLSNMLRVLDTALVSSSLDVDLNNSYYIYIMVGLYLAIPAVVGQLVLGAKAGVAGLATGIIDPAKEAGRAAASGFSAEKSISAQAAGAAVRQAAYGKKLRESGLAGDVIAASNRQAMLGLQGAAYSAMSQGAGYIGQMKRTDAEQMQQTAAAWAGTAKAYIGQAAVNADVTGKLAGRASQAALFFTGAGAPTGGGIANEYGMRAGGGVPTGKGEVGLTGAGQGGSGQKYGGRTGADLKQFGGFISNAVGGVSDASHGILMAVQNSIDGAVAAGNYSRQTALNYDMAGITAQQAQYGVSQFQTGQQKEGFGIAQQRITSQANFGAEMGAWSASRDLANAASGELAAMGVQGALSPGQKPTELMGMAMSGMLDTGSVTVGGQSYGNTSYAAGKFASIDYARDQNGNLIRDESGNPKTSLGGIFGGAVGTQTSFIDQNFGYGRVQPEFRGTTMGQAAYQYSLLGSQVMDNYKGSATAFSMTQLSGIQQVTDQAGRQTIQSNPHFGKWGTTAGGGYSPSAVEARVSEGVTKKLPETPPGS